MAFDGLPVTAAARAPPVTSARRLLVLLSIGVFINYVDRGNLATAAPVIQSEFHLSARATRLLLSAFYYGYVAMMVPVGWLAERYGAKVDWEPAPSCGRQRR